MEIAHTPGPWSAGSDATELMHADCRSGDSAFLAIDAPEHGALAVVVTRLDDGVAGSRETLQLEANARLIIAAPNLLAALQDMVSMYEAVQPAGGYQGVYEIARAAIELATKAPA
ncbi:MAG: hypothetical protein V4857_14170 [Pseudomonadota bacterium]